MGRKDDTVQWVPTVPSRLSFWWQLSCLKVCVDVSF